MRAVFEWLDVHPGFYWAGAAGATLALVGWLTARDAGKARRAEFVFAGLLLLFLFAWRWPYLFAANEYNPDESQLIAGAMTLWHDPVPWRTLDVATSGPVNYYALDLAHLAGLPFDYFAARLTGLLLVWGALLAVYRLFASRARPALAQLAVLSPAVFFAGASDWDFIHYSSEHVPLFLTAVAAAGLFLRPPGAGGIRPVFLGALAAGLLPWAKLQAAPIGAVLGGLRLLQLWFIPDPAAARRRELAAIAAGALLPSLFFLAVLAGTGQLAMFWQSYLRANVSYIQDAPPAGALLRQFADFAGARSHLTIHMLAAGASVTLAAGSAVRRRQRVGFFPLLGAAAFAGAVACVLVPQRPLLHYALLTVVPLGWLTGAALVAANPGRVGAAIFAGIALLPLGWRACLEDPDELGRLALDWRQPRSLAGSLLRARAAAGDTLAVWGWQPSLHVDSGLPQGTHDANTSWSMPLAPASQRDYYQARYLRDLAVNRPRFFVDAVGPGAPFFEDRARSAHEQVPALADFVAQHYRLWLETGPIRIYIRNDDAMPAPGELAVLEARARAAPGLAASQPVSSQPARLQSQNVRGLPAQMLLPESRLEWQLDGTERAVWLDYGFHPQAFTAGRSNGAEFIVELQPAGQAPQPLFHRLIDPQHRIADRLPLCSRLVLPPCAPGTRLIVRTTAGPDGDAAWDWVYLQRVRFQRSLRYLAEQFPGFNRVPDEAAAAHASIITNGRDSYVSLHAPASLRFALAGSERLLEFDFGFDAGAYERGGQTDGAVFSVVVHRAGTAEREIFSRYLHPVAEAADRGRQHARVALPAGLAGNDLVVRIAPGPGASWDWTYVAALELR